MIQRFIESIQGKSLRVVLPEGKEPRVVAAARRLIDGAIAEPIVLGTSDEIRQAAETAGVSVEGLCLLDPATSDLLEPFVSSYAKKRDLQPPIARRIVKRPLYFAGMMVAAGEAESLVAGATCATAAVISAGVLTVGLADTVQTPSSFFLMMLPEAGPFGRRDLIYADCGMNISPTPEQLADIAIASAHSAQRLLPEPPRVALLSFSTHGSAAHKSIDQVTRAWEIARQKAPHLSIDGELQADAALVPSVAAKKVKRPSSVAGQANVLIFPDLNAGNIAYKLTEYLAGAEAIGPVLQGFAKPLSDLSRGATVEDIVDAATICLVQAQNS